MAGRLRYNHGPYLPKHLVYHNSETTRISFILGTSKFLQQLSALQFTEKRGPIWKTNACITTELTLSGIKNPVCSKICSPSIFKMSKNQNLINSIIELKGENVFDESPCINVTITLKFIFYTFWLNY